MSSLQLRKLVCSVLFVLLLLKASQTWIFHPSWLSEVKKELADEGPCDQDTEFCFQNEDLERDYEQFEKEPSIETRRCDACRIIASRIDTSFEMAEALILSDNAGREELTDKEVHQIAAYICHKGAFKKVIPVEWKEKKRLAGPGIEMWKRLVGKHRKLLIEQNSITDWRTRMNNHCLYYMEKLPALRLYQVWLRTSANVKEGFEMFLCHGEGIFGDCMDWTLNEQSKWPYGDFPIEDKYVKNANNRIEENWKDMDFLQDLDFAWETASNSAQPLL